MSGWGQIRPSYSIAVYVSLSPDSCRSRRMAMMAESGHKGTRRQPGRSQYKLKFMAADRKSLPGSSEQRVQSGFLLGRINRSWPIDLPERTFELQALCFAPSEQGGPCLR
jgi:hypothetical protein